MGKPAGGSEEIGNGGDVEELVKDDGVDIYWLGMDGEDNVKDGLDGVMMVLDAGGELVLVMAGGCGMVGIGGLWWVDGGQLLLVCAEQKDGGWVWCQGCKVGPWRGEGGRW